MTFVRQVYKIDKEGIKKLPEDKQISSKTFVRLTYF